MRQLPARYRIALGLLGSVIAVVVGIGPAPASAAGSYVPADESTVIAKVNATRASKGLSRLAKRDELVGMARRQADAMAAKGAIFHNGNLGGEITSLGVQWLRVGENVGMGPNVDLIYAALLESPKHYENIVRPEYNSIGLGVVSEGGLRYLVQVFGNLKGASAPAHAPPAPAAKPAAAPATVKPAAAVHPAAPSRPVAPKPTPTVRPTPRPSFLPNALTGGYVRPTALPALQTASDQAKRTRAASEGSEPRFGHLIDILAFWS